MSAHVSKVTVSHCTASAKKKLEQERNGKGEKRKCLSSGHEQRDDEVKDGAQDGDFQKDMANSCFT